MVDRKEPIPLRNKRLFRSVICRSGPMKRCTGMKMTQDALLDAFILLFDECSKESIKKDVCITSFINKYRSLVTEIKSLRVNLQDFTMEAMIGRGHFGEVRVVREKQTNDVYAMKILKKSKTAACDTGSLFEEEHDIMCTNTSPWLTSIQYSFQDKENLYFVMEYHPGGDLLSLLDRYNGTFTPDMAKFYLAETALAVRALHQMGYVHRDIKPDNILLDRCGHVKLADFGSAALLTASGVVNQTMPVGTPEYVAPEILLSVNSDCADKKKFYYGVECDYWSLGVLAYEMIVGRTPFSGAELKVTYFKIMNHKKLNYPENVNVPETLQDLINKLLDDASVRLKHEGLTKHPFFIDIDWNNIRNEAPPFVPTLTSANDTSNFLEFENKKSTPKVDFKESKKDFSGKDLPFIGFTFSNNPDLKNDQGIHNDSTLDAKGSVLESVLARVRRENQNLVSKLCEAEFGKTSELERLEKGLEEKSKLFDIAEADRTKLIREVAKAQAENANLRRTLELERQDRKDMEANALNLIRQNKVKLERDMSNLVSQLNSKIEELNDKLTEAHTLNNELASKYDRTEGELSAAKDEIDRLKSLETLYKEKVAKAREMKRQSVVGLESRIEQLANENHSQANILQQKLNEEIQAKNEAVEKIKEMEMILAGKEAQFMEEMKEYEEKIVKLEMKIDVQHSEIASLQVRLAQKPNVVLLEQKLESEKMECAQLRSRIALMETELANTTSSFVEHETAIAVHEENMTVLEKELRQVSEEKMELLKQLQKTKEVEEENRQKLSSLKVVVDRLEEGVIKLEAENTRLKQQLVAYSQPIKSEVETRYQERITILEDQVVRLESQLQKLRETAVLEKENLRSTQNALWKAEKDLSNAKIDIRIARRETKTAEDTVAKLNDELKKMTEKINAISAKSMEDLAAEREKLESLSEEITKFKTEISEKDWEIKMLKSKLEDFEELKKSNKQLKKEYNEMGQNCKILEKQLEASKEEKESIKENYQSLEMTKLKLESTIEEMKHKICSLELNNTVLKETGAMMDEQLEDYEKFTASQTQKIEQLIHEKSVLEKEIESVQSDLRVCRQSLNEEKSFKLKAEQRVSFLENELANTEDNISSLEGKLRASNCLTEELKEQVKDLEEKVANYELDIQEWKRMYGSLEAECQWLKQETTNNLTNLYSLRESNYKLTLNLEEEQQLVAALQERITELQNVITEIEAFHKQREVKDEATKQQQNKLITFLQTKLDDVKKKKTLSDVLFGSRTKENYPTNNWMLPKSARALDFSAGKTMKSPIVSPNQRRVLSQIVKSPSSQFQRQTSLQRMHHNIPHRFKNQLAIRSGKCDGCHSNVNRGCQMAVCTHCGIVAHPKCSVTIPKTCGLPDGFAKHYAKTLNTDSKSTEVKPIDMIPPRNAIHEGWIKIPKLDCLTWERKYARLEKDALFIYDDKPQDNRSSPIQSWNLSPNDNKIVIGEVTDTSGLPSTAKSDIPYIIKIALIPMNSCWPKDVYHIMVPIPADKPVWLSALNEVILKEVPDDKPEYTGLKLLSFNDENILQKIKCAVHVNDKIMLLGGCEGLFSLKIDSGCDELTRIEGVTNVTQISIAKAIGLALLIVDDNEIVETDFRSLMSNAEALPCVNPSITVSQISVVNIHDKTCLLFSLSDQIDGNYYLTVATPSCLIFLKWNMNNSEFVVLRTLETLFPCKCIHYSHNSVIVGCDKFFRINLKDFVVQEFVDPSVKSLAFWKIKSSPMQIFALTENEFLLCYYEYGVFVNMKGEKIQPNLKWSKVPCDFAFRKPYLFIMHNNSVEVIRLSDSSIAQSCDDTVSTASTATIHDSIFIKFNCPNYLGPSQTSGSIIISAERDLIILDGRQVYKDKLGSCISLSTITDGNHGSEVGGDEFSFTSSVVNSLCAANVGSSTPRLSDESDSCNTYTISDNNMMNSGKKVSFVQHAL